MSLRAQANLADDFYLQRRVTACATKEGIPNPVEWVRDRTWVLSAQPGWAAAYDSASLVGNVSPGNADNVITDGMILSAVQALKKSEAADANPTGA